MSDDNPWTDDRDRQASLFGDTDATRTMDRSGETVTGSDSFADDRDTGSVDPGEQAGLFEQTEELEGQAALGGGTATQTESEGFFGQDGGLTDVDQSRAFAFDDYGPTSREPIPDEERQRALQGTGLAPGDTRRAQEAERQSRRRQTDDRPDDLAEQLAAQRAAPTLTRPSAEPAVQLSDVEGRGRDTGERTDEAVSIGPRGSGELDRNIGASEQQMQFDAEPGVSLFDVGETDSGDDGSAPGEFVGRTDRGTEERIDVRQAGGQFYPQRIERDPETGEIFDQETLDAGTRSREEALETARREFADQTDQDDDGTPDTAEVRLELPDSRAAEAGQLVARMGERGILDVGDQSALGDVRAELQRIEDGDGALNLSDDQARAFGDAIEQVGSDLPASQQPQGFELLPDSDELVEEPSGTPGSDDGSPSSGGRIEQFDFGSREFANETRDELPDDAMTGRFDRRNKTVEVDVSKLSDSERQRLESAAARSFADEEAESPGLTELSESERESLSSQSVSWSWQKYGFQAMRAKSALRSRGVKGTEWLDYYEPGESWRSSVEKLDDARERAARGGGATGIDGERKDSMDERLTRGGIARNIEQRRGDLKEFALRGAREGDEEAISVLVNEFDVPEERARGFVDDTDSEQERVEMMETVVARVEANGRFTTPPPQDAPRSPGKRGRSSGQYVGDEVITPADPGAPIRRDPETGQFFVAEGERGNGAPPSGPVTETQVQRGDIR